MNFPAAFRATYSDWRLVKTRGVVQVVFEVPLADSDLAYDVLGGMPNASHERWFGIAAIKPETEVMPNTEGYDSAVTRLHKARPDQEQQPRPDWAKRDWRDLGPAQQAGIRCEEPVFAAFLKENHPDDWREAGSDAAECVRLLCQVSSRSELATNHRARVIWRQLDDEFAAWKALEHA